MSDALSETGFVNRKAGENNQLHCQNLPSSPLPNTVWSVSPGSALQTVGSFDLRCSGARGFSRRPVSESYSCASRKQAVNYYKDLLACVSMSGKVLSHSDHPSLDS